MKTQTLNTQIKDLNNECGKGFLRQLAGVSAQTYRDARSCLRNAAEDGVLAPDTTQATKLADFQNSAVAELVKNFGDLTVREFFENNNIEYSERKGKRH